MNKFALLLILVSVNAQAATAFFSHEILSGGMTKQCVYNYLGSTYVRTQSTVSSCPLTIEV